MMEDDWMHPKTSFSYAPPPPKNGTYFQIQRKRATPVSGNVAYVYNWDVWKEFETKEERDAELSKLREQNPMWHLRARTLHYLNGSLIGGGDPFEYRDESA